MNEQEEINIFRALDFIRDNAPKYAKAKSERVYLEEFKKAKLAILMKQAELEGIEAANKQERDALANLEYKSLLDGLKQAVEEEERLRWQIVAAQAKIEVFRTLEANKRYESKIIQ